MLAAHAGPPKRDPLRHAVALLRLGVPGAAGLVTAVDLLSTRAFAAGEITAGVIYVGPKDDYSYSQATAAIKKMAGVTVVEQEKVAETNDVQNVMASMIEQDGVS